jgi:hypothetical protein
MIEIKCEEQWPRDRLPENFFKAMSHWLVRLIFLTSSCLILSISSSVSSDQPVHIQSRCEDSDDDSYDAEVSDILLNRTVDEDEDIQRMIFRFESLGNSPGRPASPPRFHRVVAMAEATARVRAAKRPADDDTSPGTESPRVTRRKTSPPRIRKRKGTPTYAA